MRIIEGMTKVEGRGGGEKSSEPEFEDSENKDVVERNVKIVKLK